MIVCPVCKAQFTSSGASNGKQGNGCASNIFQKDGEWFIAGYYGSRLFDMDLWKFVPPLGQFGSFDPRKYEGEAVCDVCFQVSVNVKALVFVKEHGP